MGSCCHRQEWNDFKEGFEQEGELGFREERKKFDCKQLTKLITQWGKKKGCLSAGQKHEDLDAMIDLTGEARSLEKMMALHARLGEKGSEELSIYAQFVEAAKECSSSIATPVPPRYARDVIKASL